MMIYVKGGKIRDTEYIMKIIKRYPAINIECVTNSVVTLHKLTS